jgi:uncharacterized protein (TIGR02444 family)
VTDAPHALWRYAVAAYARPEVREACLALQDRHGADVNLLLLCAWRAAVGAPALGTEDLAACAAAVEPWRRGAVERLRGVRRRLEAAAVPALRAEVLAAELDAEYVEQALLMRALQLRGRLDALRHGVRGRRGGAAGGRDEVAMRSLLAYCALLGVAPEGGTLARLRTIARAVSG